MAFLSSALSTSAAGRPGVDVDVDADHEGIGGCSALELVVIESTSDYWRQFFYVLSEAVPVMLVKASDVKGMPGRKTDVSDAEWLADLAAHGLVRASFVPAEPQRQLRDLTRARVGLFAEP